jgi:hypothetical protein
MSTSAFFIQPFKVSAEQSIFDEIDMIADHREARRP